MAEATLAAIRRILLAILLIGLGGMATELVFLEHHEEATQLIPLVLIGLAFVAIAWHAAQRSGASLVAFQITMVLLIAAGLLGVYLHYQANVEFQREVDPSIAGRALLWKALAAKTPPPLAPGSMAQLGLIGLAYSFRYPVRQGDRAPRRRG